MNDDFDFDAFLRDIKTDLDETSAEPEDKPVSAPAVPAAPPVSEIRETEAPINTRAEKKAASHDKPDKKKNITLLAIAGGVLVALLIFAILSSPKTPAAETQAVQEQTGNGFVIATPQITPSPPSKWSVKYYVDDFGDPTGDFYVGSDAIQGTFSNTATNGSSLTVRVLYDDDDDTGFRFVLLEYNKYRATHYSSDALKLLFKIDGTTYSCALKAGNSSSSDVHTGTHDLNPSDVTAIETFRDALFGGNTINCVIYIGSSKYSFSVPGDGFYDTIREYIDMRGE